MVDSILVSVDFSNKNDTGVMVVGRKRMNQSVEIINAFQGDEARELYEKLITKKKKEEYKMINNYAKCNGCPYYFGEIDSCMYGEEDIPNDMERKCESKEG